MLIDLGLLLTAFPFAAGLPKKTCGANLVASPPPAASTLPFTRTRADVLDLAHDSFVALTTRDDYPQGWAGHNGFTTLAQFDRQRGTRDFYDFVSKGQGADHGWDVYNVPLCNDFNDDRGWAALGSLEAYKAYGDEIFKDRAVAVFDHISKHGYIHQSDVDAGHIIDTKYDNITLRAECGGQSMLGGVSWRNGAPAQKTAWASNTNPNVNAVSSGLYALLGAQLCDLTHNTTFCDLAYTSVQWMDRLMVDPSGLLNDHVNSATCELIKWVFTYNAGLYIGAYGTLGHVTGNQTALDLAKRTLQASLAAHWNNDQGVIIESTGDATEENDSVSFKGPFIRYMHLVYEWMPTELQSSILRYINTQYASLVNRDSDNALHPVLYGRNWAGPFTVSTGRSMIAAMDVLNALQLNPDHAFPSSSDTTKPAARL